MAVLSSSYDRPERQESEIPFNDFFRSDGDRVRSPAIAFCPPHPLKLRKGWGGGAFASRLLTQICSKLVATEPPCALKALWQPLRNELSDNPVH